MSRPAATTLRPCRPRKSMPVRRIKEAARLSDLLRSYLVEAIGEAFVGTAHPFVVSAETPEQVNAVLSICAYHRLGLSVAAERPASSAEFASGDVDVVLLLSTLAGACAPQ